MTADYEELKTHLAKLEYNKKVKRLTMVLRKAKQLRDRDVINKFCKKYNVNEPQQGKDDPPLILLNNKLVREGRSLSSQETSVAFQLAVEKYRIHRSTRSDTSSLSSLAFEPIEPPAEPKYDINANVNKNTVAQTANAKEDEDKDKDESDVITETTNDVITNDDDIGKDDGGDNRSIGEEELFNSPKKGVDTEDELMQDGGREIREEFLRYQKIYSDLSNDQVLDDEDRQVVQMLSYLQNLVPVPEHVHRCDHVHDDIGAEGNTCGPANGDYDAYEMRDDNAPLLPRPRAVVFENFTVYPDGYLKPLPEHPPENPDDISLDIDGANGHTNISGNHWPVLCNSNGYPGTPWMRDGLSGLRTSARGGQYSMLKTLDSEAMSIPNTGFDYQKVLNRFGVSAFVGADDDVRDENPPEYSSLSNNDLANSWLENEVAEPLERIQMQIRKAFQPIRWQRKGYSHVTEYDDFGLDLIGDDVEKTKESLV